MISLLDLKRQLWAFQGLRGGILGGGKDDNNNDGINQAALANANVAKEALDWYKSEYAATKPQRDASTAIANKATNTQIDLMQQQADQSKDTYDYQKGTFRPVEEKLATTAQAFDTPERREAEAGNAIADVRAGFENQRSQINDQLATSGITPNSGAALATMRKLGVSQAGAEAQAANKARNGVETQGWARMSDVANLGRNISANATTQAAGATSAGTAATGSAATANGINNSGAALMQSGFNTATAGNQSAGNLYGQAAGVGSSDFASGMQGIAGLASAAGQIFGKSSKDSKTDKHPVSASMRKAMGGHQPYEGTPVEEWKYKPGGGDGQKHLGPYAEDVEREFGEDMAPEGQAINLTRMSKRNLNALADLSQQLDQLEAQIHQLTSGAR